MKIVLTGFMAAGKTTVAKIIAKNKNLKFYDSDQIIEKKEEMSIKEIFRKKGEKCFRKLEKKTIKKIINSKEDFILAPGGGAILDEDLRNLFINKVKSICLDVSAEEVLKRIRTSTEIRPLLETENPLKEIKLLLEKRKEFYEQISHHINTDNLSAHKIANLILDTLPDRQIYIDVEAKNSYYPVIIDKNYKKNSFQKVIKKIKNRKVFLLADKLVMKHHGENIIDQIKEVSDLVKLELDAGEKIKDFKYLQKAYNILYDNNFSRSDYIIAFGGGTIGDLGGLIASTYLRGLKLIQMPTTLISQVDSSVGGKTAVNFRNTKNLIGTFYQAELVYYQLEWLKTLELREIKSGLGEIIKYAVLDSGKLFDILQNNRDKILALDKEILLEISEISLKMKRYYVNADLKDKGVRKKLNLGHSFGHAVEGAEKFKYKHGEAVVMGIAFTAFLSHEIGALSTEERNKIISLIKDFDYKLKPTNNVKVENLASFIAHDKKISDNKMWWVLINKIGDTYLSDRFDHKNIRKYMEEYLCKKLL